MTRLFPLAIALAGCIQIPDQNAPQCYSSTDCDQAAGEVCAEGVCYGDPPTGTFAISISAPADRTDLTGVERATEDLPAYGYLADLTLETPVGLSGRVTAASCAPPILAMDCPTGTLGASITISRPPRFPGGNGFEQTAQSTAGAADASFTLPVPRTRPGDQPYTITVVPDDLGAGSGSGVAPAELVPPLRTTVRASEDMQEMQLALGSDDPPVISGDLIDAEGTPLTDYRVSAIGRWTGDTTDSEVSSVAYTPDGHFQIVLSNGLAGAVTIVAKPTGMGAVEPTLQLVGVDSSKSSTQQLMQPAAVGVQRITTVTVQGTSSGGAVGPISGALVIASATVTAAAFPAPGSNLQAVISAEVTTGDDGVAQLPLLDGTAFAAGFELRVVPPAGSNLAVLEQAAFPLADASLVLKPRIALQGKVVDSTGKPVRDVSVTVRPSLHFQWDLPDAAQVFLAQIPAGTAVTPDTGDFVVFVDPFIEDVFGHYDITFEPPSGSSVPSYTVADFEIPRGTIAPAALAVGTGSGSAAATVTLPEAAALHGLISDAGGNPVAGSELRVFRLPADNTLCTQPHAPTNCQVPAQLQAHATSDADGLVRFTLPRTP